MSAAARPPTGIWSLDDDQLVNVDGFDAGAVIVLVPSEQVLLAVIDLPLPDLRRRAAAAPFAIEDRIARSIDEVHVALGAELAPRRHLVGIVDRAVMDGWVARLAEAGLDRAALVPDALALPVTAEGWSVDLSDMRALVRTGDGAGFALPATQLLPAWVFAGRPKCAAYGNALPGEMIADIAATALDRTVAQASRPALDLRQGAFARPGRSLPRLWRRVAMVALAGAAAHVAIAAADTVALARIAAQRTEAARILLRQTMPDAAASVSLATDLANLAPVDGALPSAFLPLLSRAAVALGPLGPAARLRSVAFDAAAGTMELEIEAPDVAALAQAGGALGASGLGPQAGAAAQENGSAIGAFTIRSRP